MRYKRAQNRNIAICKPQNKIKLMRALCLQIKMDDIGVETIYIDEFSTNERSFKYSGWSKSGEQGMIKSYLDDFTMNFFVAFSKSNFYGIMGNEVSSNSETFLEFLRRVMERRRAMPVFGEREAAICLDNASIHKSSKVKAFAAKHKLRIITIPPYEPCLNPVEKLILAVKMKLRMKKKQGKHLSLRLVKSCIDELSEHMLEGFSRASRRESVQRVINFP